jgi:uncharacterized protein DUF4258
MTFHAMEEMAEDNLNICDVEEAVLNGELVRRNKRDVRGPKYTVEGRALDGETVVAVVGRFTDKDRLLIITVYDVNNYH